MEKTDLSAAKVIKEVSDILESKTEKASDRLKAAELLLKHLDNEEKKKAVPKTPGNKAIAQLTTEEIHKEFYRLHNRKLPEVPNTLNIDDLYKTKDAEDTQDIEAVDAGPGTDV